MRIAVLEPYIEGIGGAQKVIAKYSDFLSRKGHEVVIFTQRYNKSTCYPLFHKIKIKTIGFKSKFLSPFAFMFQNFNDFDLVLANDWPTHFSSFFNKNVLWVCYTPKRDFYDLRELYFKNSNLIGKISLFFKSLLFKKLDYIAAKKCFSIMPQCKNTKNRVEKYYHIPVHYIFKHGIDFNQFKIGKMKDYFISVNRLADNKRIDLIIKAMSYVKNKKIKLLVVGDGPKSDYLKKLSKNNPNIIFTGRLKDLEVSRAYSSAIALIYVPLDEDFGLGPLEAGASSIPTIGSNEGGLKETIVNNKTGFLIDKISPQEIAKKMDFLFSKREISRKMGLEAKKYVSKWDWNKILPDFEKKLISFSRYKK